MFFRDQTVLACSELQTPTMLFIGVFKLLNRGELQASKKLWENFDSRAFSCAGVKCIIV